ncbi:hypothetical protein FSP39_002810 [Pinctada imbricata]|uniref:TIR domain-containing protein n=1 Tax=Pinctada imbricata TaxID=66713 RepID=A0AA89BKF2_PINIB|nr:hypothetical protein FSP39_002810 [Pinctada imbricata]
MLLGTGNTGKGRNMYIFIILAFNIYVITIQAIQSNIKSLPWKRFCDIIGVEAKCSGHGKNMTQIPQLPPFVQKLILDNDHFRKITSETFNPIIRSKMNVTKLSFKNSVVHFIGAHAFKNIPSLQSLNLASNRKLNLTSLKNSFSSLQGQNISYLGFSEMAWTYESLSVGLFENLSSRNIDRLVLRSNEISRIPNSSLEGLQKLKIFDLSSNQIKDCEVEFSRLYGLEDLNLERNEVKSCNVVNLPKNLKILRLGSNRLLDVPLFCSSTKDPSLPYLEELVMSDNLISMLTESSFECIQSLTHLDLSMNEIRHFRPRVFLNLLNLEDLKLRKMKQRVIRIDDGAFSMPSVRKFYFDQNLYEFDTLKRARRASLSNCTKLELLDLSWNYMPKFPPAVRYVLNGLINLKKLYLERVYWNEVPKDLFKMMPNIEEVDLSSNGITNLSRGHFLNESKIVRMKLHNNRIAHVRSDTFPEVFWKSIKIIDLSANPFACDCDLLWFRDLLRKSKDQKITFKRYPLDYKCLIPQTLKGVRLANFNMTSEECQKKSELVVAIATSGSVIAFGIMVIVIAYRCRWHIRYWIYLLRYQKKDYNILLSERFKYAGFIIYSENDCDFVHNTLLAKLENELGYQMCVHYRDFEVGKMIVDNIVECMSQSRHALVVISKTFCQSKWCKFEMLLAQDRWLRNESGALIIVMLEEVNSRYMTKDLRALIQTTTYCSWTENEVGQELFWEQLFSSFKKG